MKIVRKVKEKPEIFPGHYVMHQNTGLKMSPNYV